MTDEEKQAVETLTRSFTKMETLYKVKCMEVETKEAEISRLKAENAALRERLEKAVELPCKVGDTVYQYDNAGRIYVSKIKNIVYETNGIAFDKRAINNSIFLTRAEAEARFAELKGGKNE